MADQLTEEQIRFYREAFSHFIDKDGDGISTTKDFGTMMKTMMVAVIGSDGPHDSVIQDMINGVVNEVEADSSGTGTIDFPNSMTLLAKKVDPSLFAAGPSPKHPCEHTPTHGCPSTYSAESVPMDEDLIGDDKDDNMWASWGGPRLLVWRAGRNGCRSSPAGFSIAKALTDDRFHSLLGVINMLLVPSILAIDFVMVFL